MKLHLGCGTVYLSGYHNIDVQRPGMYLASQRPDLVEQLSTDFGNYYKRHMTIGDLDKKVAGVCDEYADIANLSYPINSIEEIVCVHALEHLSYTQVLQALDKWWNILKPDGKLIIAVPDMRNILEQLISTTDPERRNFLMRHILGSDKHIYAIHRTNFTAEQLRNLLDECCFENIRSLENGNFYPAIWTQAHKPDWLTEVREVQMKRIGVLLPDPGDGKRILDVGCGSDPLSCATDCLDFNQSAEHAVRKGQKFYHWDICNTDFKDKEIDFVYASHMLEHVWDIEKALKEISRIGKEGMIIAPTQMTDQLMQYGHIHPYWYLSSRAGKLVVQKKTQRDIESSQDGRMEAVIAAIVRGPVYLNYNERRIRKWFWGNQSLFHNVLYWKNQIDYEIYQ